ARVRPARPGVATDARARRDDLDPPGRRLRPGSRAGQLGTAGRACGLARRRFVAYPAPRLLDPPPRPPRRPPPPRRRPAVHRPGRRRRSAGRPRPGAACRHLITPHQPCPTTRRQLRPGTPPHPHIGYLETWYRIGVRPDSVQVPGEPPRVRWRLPTLR